MDMESSRAGKQIYLCDILVSLQHRNNRFQMTWLRLDIQIDRRHIFDPLRIDDHAVTINDALALQRKNTVLNRCAGKPDLLCNIRIVLLIKIKQ